MPIADLLKHLFPDVIRARGRNYYRSGAVDLVEGDPFEVRARVSGGHLYDVGIALTDEGLAVSCSCPYFDGAGVCKHIWATLLCADDKGYLAGHGDGYSPYEVLEQEDLDEGWKIDQPGLPADPVVAGYSSALPWTRRFQAIASAHDSGE